MLARIYWVDRCWFLNRELAAHLVKCIQVNCFASVSRSDQTCFLDSMNVI